MWICPNCDRVFEKEKQPHSCHKVALDLHFKNKEKAKILFEYLVEQIKSKVGECQIISLPCCVHLFGNYDFLAALPKKDRLEVRFSLDRVLTSSRLKQSVSVSKNYFKNCVDIGEISKIDDELIDWITESYQLKTKE